MAEKLNEVQEAVIRERGIPLYLGGASLKAVSVQLGRSQCAVRRVFTEAGLSLRGHQTACRLHQGLDPPEISDSALWAAYWASDSGYPSILALCARWGVGEHFLRTRIQKAGFRLRSSREQALIEHQSGRHSIVSYRGDGGHKWTTENRPDRSGPKSPDHLRRLGIAHRRRVRVLCYWCGLCIERKLSWSRANERHFCSKQHSNFGIAHARYRPETPRPLIVERLKGIQSEPGLKSLPLTYEILEKAGATIGAREPEILAVLAP